jgi:CRISPR/Cas system CSM-associated protein Csm3 (group 7 of RAMP superfamily)
MNKQGQHWSSTESRHIAERIVVEGELELLTPACFGSGDTEGAADLALLRDAYDGAAVLPGASIAGALRNYWREWTQGYGAVSQDSVLFGAKRGAKDEMEGDQSLLIVEDAFGIPETDGSFPKPQVELRDGVKIGSTTRTAEEKKLYDIELLRAGTRFRLHLELLIAELKPKDMDWGMYEQIPQIERDARLRDQRQHLSADLSLALHGFESAEIGLGARKRRGLGKCQVNQWHVWRYNLTTPDGLLAWLAQDRVGDVWQKCPTVAEATGNTLAEKLGTVLDQADKRDRFEISANFALDSSMLVRSGFGQADQGPDAVHFHRTRYGEPDISQAEREPVLPGTSLAGVLRARALRIANTLSTDRVKAGRLINQLFGVGPEDAGKEAHRASRLIAHEAALQNVHSLVQNRIRIDRFTGGAMDNYLFNEAPVFGDGSNTLNLELTLRKPDDYEIGLLLLLLKDLWTGDLAVGGESSVGRGRLRGLDATVTRVQGNGTTHWKITQTANGLDVTCDQPGDAPQSLQAFVQALNDHLGGR